MAAIILAYGIFSILLGMSAGSIMYATLKCFPVSIRFSGSCISFNLSMSIFGGTAPLLGLYLSNLLKDPAAPAFILMCTSILTMFAVLTEDEITKELFMTIRSVIKMGNVKLKTPSSSVTDFTSIKIKELINDMRDTMAEKGGVGIAAPQIGCNLRVIMFGFENNPRYPNEKPVPFTVLINPDFEKLSDEMVDDWEGCLSVPGLRGLVTRHKMIRYSGYDLEGNPISRIAEGFHARVVQHECDHIDGILYPQRIKDIKFFGFEEELKEIIWGKTSS